MTSPPRAQSEAQLSSRDEVERRAVSSPVGVFDSGVGGLAVLFELRRLLPAESYLYFADTLNCPWGSRSDDEIVELAVHAAQTLVDAGSKIIVVACNSATTVAMPTLRGRFTIPFVGTEPAVKPAAARTKSGCVGVMATQATVRSGSVHKLAERYASAARVVSFPCPDKLVELVEQATIDGAEVEKILGPIIEQVIAHSIDVLVLGCTHYSFLRATIERMAGAGVSVLDTGEPVARQTQRVLEIERALMAGERTGGVQYLASADPARVAAIAAALRRAVFSSERV